VTPMLSGLVVVGIAPVVRRCDPNTLGNLAGASRVEKTVFAATTAVVAGLSADVALS
jgi:hypothetical protein